MTLYSKNASYPDQIPSRIRLSDGRTRTDPSTFTPSEIADAGYIEVVDPPAVEYPNILEWLPGTLEWLVRTPNESDTLTRWEIVRQECIARLAATDYKVIKSVESGVAVDSNVVAYRQELRDIYNDVNAMDPWSIVWPVLTTPEE